MISQPVFPPDGHIALNVICQCQPPATKKKRTNETHCERETENTTNGLIVRKQGEKINLDIEMK